MLIAKALLVFLAIFYGSSGLYLWKGFFHQFYHDILKWHQPDNSPKSFDGCSIHAKCKWCHKDIMQDSQGNWF